MEAVNHCAGCVYVVATPIGNLRDVSMRALETLGQVDLILCEDTRVSGKILSHYGVHTPLCSLHAHNEYHRGKELIDRLRSGRQMALISDAGVPTLSDPGRLLVAAAHHEGIKVVPIPGPSAVLAALSCSGFDAERFVFEGFLPSRRSRRIRRLEALADETRTLVFYEAPHRITAMLTDVQSILGNERLVCLAKELTKAHEKLITAPPAEVLTWLNEEPVRKKGEFTVVLQDCSKNKPMPSRLQISEQDLYQALLQHLPPRKAAQITVRFSGGSANRLYRNPRQKRKDFFIKP